MLTTDELSSMTLDLKSGESIELAGARVQFIQKSGARARINVLAPRDMQIKKVQGDEPDSRTKHGVIHT